MDYDHPLMKELKMTDEKVTVLCKRMDDDLAERVEEARRGDDPVLLVKEIADAARAQAVRWREAN